MPTHVVLRGGQRLVFLDALRAVAALIIAGHHICLYGPLPRLAETALPSVVEFFDVQGRIAVQVFLVVSGFVTAYSVGAAPVTRGSTGRFVLRRLLRLGIPYYGILLVVLAVHAGAVRYFGDFSLAGQTSWRQVLAHLLFLQDILGFEGLSAGIWYVGIDLQFGVAFILLLALTQIVERASQGRGAMIRGGPRLLVFAPIAVASLFWFNLNAANDVWVHYYFGSLFLGIIGAWALTGRVHVAAFFGYVLAVMAALAYCWRLRLAVALVTGLLIFWVGRQGRLHEWLNWRPLQLLGKVSYSLFLCHYCVSWLIGNLGYTLTGERPWAAAGWMLLSLLGSVGAACLFYLALEKPSVNLAHRLR